MQRQYTVEQHFSDKEPLVRAIYDRLLAELHAFGDVYESPKQTSIHLDNATGFAGVYTRQSYINLHFRLDHKLDSPRITKCEQLSPRRFKHTVKLTNIDSVDDELMSWLKSAYDISA